MTSQSNFRGKYIIKAILFCIVFTLVLVLFSFAKTFIPENFERLAHGIIGTLAAFVTTFLFLKFDNKKFSDIGLVFDRNTLIKFFVGVITGIIIMGLLAASVIYFGHLEVHVNPNNNILYFLLMTAPVLPLAFMEELAFRGYPLEILKEKTGIRLSLIITSILFALYHIANGWTIASSFYGPAVWGLIFGLTSIYSRGIAMPTGIHYAANLTTSSLGAKNHTGSIWIVNQPDTTPADYGGPDWLTILPSLALLVLAIICIEVYMRIRTKTMHTKGLLMLIGLLPLASGSFSQGTLNPNNFTAYYQPSKTHQAQLELNIHQLPSLNVIDYTGTWVLNLEKSKLEDRPDGLTGSVFVIKQTGDQFSLTRYHIFGDKKKKISFQMVADGKTRRIKVFFKGKLEKNGDNLQATLWRKNFLNVVHYKFGDNPNEFIADEVMTSKQNKHHNIWFFEREIPKTAN